ncbi:MAG: PilW family protein [Gammaproteobacteria bacterium]|nr:PilW family protein [Gammaproteobacteria bacterium]
MSSRHHARQRGMSLIELMIAMVIGLIILAGVINIFVASRQSTRYSDGLRSMQENGRQAVFVMQSAIRQAGYSTGDPILAVDLANSDTDKISVRYQADSDCTGTATGAATPPGIAVNTYSYDLANKQIICTGNVGAAPMPVADNVETLQFLYGLDENRDGVIERYVRYSEVGNAADIAGIQFGLLVVTDGPIKDMAVSKTYTVLDSTFTADDLYGRQVFQSMIIIRNKSS